MGTERTPIVDPAIIAAEISARVEEERRRFDRRHEVRQRFNDWLQATVRFLVLSNAGGAVATLAFIGTIWKEGSAYKPALISLGLFGVGVILTGWVILGQLQKAWEAEVTEENISDPKHERGLGRIMNRLVDVGRDWHSPLLAVAFLCFALGALIGVAILFFVTPALAVKI